MKLHEQKGTFLWDVDLVESLSFVTSENSNESSPPIASSLPRAITHRLLDAGYTVEEITNGTKLADEVRRNRDETNKQMKWDCIHYFGELTGRKFRKMSNLKKLLPSSSPKAVRTLSSLPSGGNSRGSCDVGIACVDKANSDNCAVLTTAGSLPTRRTAMSA